MRKKIINKIVIISILFFLTASPVLADGFMIAKDPEVMVWDQWTGEEIPSRNLTVGKIVGQYSQQAFTVWDKKEKMQKLMIIVDKESYEGGPINRYKTKKVTSPVFWVIPLQSQCQDIKPYHYDKFSNKLEIITVKEEAKNRQKIIRELVLGWQIWPLLSKLTPEKRPRTKSMYYSDSASIELGSSPRAYKEQIKVYQRIESFGVKTEILSAQSIDALDMYLKDKSLRLGLEAKRVLDSYISPDYCFAVSEVVDQNERGNLGIMLEFKPKKPFYPLYVTSVYNERVINVDVSIKGSYQVKMGQKVLATENIYLKNDFTYGKDEEILFQKGDILTKININEPAKQFTSDLFFEGKILKSISNQLKLNIWLVMIFLVFVLSFVLAFVIFRKKWLKAGLLNSLFGLVGMIIGFVFIKNLKINKTINKETVEDNAETESNNNYKAMKAVSVWNGLLLGFPLLLIMLFPILIFGSHNSFYFLDDFFDLIGNNNSETLALLFLIILPFSFIISLSSLFIKKVLKAKQVEIATRKLLIGMFMVLVNIFQIIVIFASIVFFIVIGPIGWIIGLFSIITFLLFIYYGYDKPAIARIILVFSPFVFVALAFLNLPAAIISLFAIYPFLVNFYYAKNIEITSDYFGEQVNLKEAGEKKQTNSLVYVKLALYSLLFVLAYMAIDALIGIFL